MERHLKASGWTVANVGYPSLRRPLAVHAEAIRAGATGKAGFNPFINGDNDGIITVAETRLLLIEADFLLLRSIYTTLPMRRDALAATLSFLETGRLQSERPAPCHF